MLDRNTDMLGTKIGTTILYLHIPTFKILLTFTRHLKHPQGVVLSLVRSEYYF